MHHQRRIVRAASAQSHLSWVALALALFLAAPAAPAEIRVTRDVTLPARSVAADVRFASNGDILIAAGKDGVQRVRRDQSGKLHWSRELGGHDDQAGFFFSRMLAASGAATVVASPFDAIGWSRSGSAVQSFAFSTAIDVEVLGDRLFLLGANRDAKGTWAPEGAIAWTGTLSKKLRDLRPLVTSALDTKPRALGVALCGTFEMGAVRAISADEVLVIPGVEPGAYVFDRNGRLVRTFDTRGLGFTDRCGVSQENAAVFARDMPSRMRWLNRIRVLDEIIAIGGRAALIVREVTAAGTRWDVIALDKNGKASPPVRLPFTSPSPHAHVRADVRGGEAVFLIRAYGERRDRADEPAPRLVFATVPAGR